jgi:Mrp family chromosome partitioning ATPase
VSGYFDTLNRRMRDVSVISVQEPAPLPPVPARALRPRPLPSGYGVMREKLLALADGRPLKTILFAGCSGGEGCTQVVREFGELLASSGLNVLCIDAGNPGPRSTAQGTEAGGALSLAEPPAPTPLGTGFLTVVASPAAMSDKERFLHAPEFAAWLDRQREAYDYVLLDAPPLLRFADGTLMGRLSDGVVIVVQADATDKDALARARDQLQRAEVAILGVVLNRARDPIPPLLRPYLAFLRD